MNDWDSIRRLGSYLEHASQELDNKIGETQNEIMKLQDILDTISPVPVSEPKEEARPQRLQQNRKVFRGFDYKVSPQLVQTSMNPFEEFTDLLDQYNSMKKFSREHLGDRFAKRLLDFSRATASHMHERLTPCVRRLSAQLDKVLDADMSQASAKFKAKYTTDKAVRVAHEFDRLVQELGALRRVDVMTREFPLEARPKPKKIDDKSEQFEILANFTPKQLNTFYRLRGNARRAMMAATMKEKSEKVFMDFLKDVSFSSDKEQLAVLQAAKRAFLILSHDPRSYATIIEP